jgi:hypothetical protein
VSHGSHLHKISDTLDLCGEFGYHHLAVAGPEIGDQNLVCSRIEGAATTARSITTGATKAAAPAAVPATTAVAATRAGAEAATAQATREVWKRTTTAPAVRIRAAAGAEKAATAATTTVLHTGTTAAASAPALATVTAVRPDEAPLAGEADNAHNDATTATATGDDQRRVAWADHETATAAATVDTTATGTTNGDLQRFASDQGEVATDFGPSTTYADADEAAASPLRAKGEDLIRVGGRHREGDKAPGIGEVEWCSARGQPRRGEPKKTQSQPTTVVSLPFFL